MEAPEILTACEAYFRGRLEVKLALVYGSAAKDELKRHSDVDIAILGEEPFEFPSLLGMRGDLEAALGREIDLIDLARSQGLIFHRAITGGRVVKKEPRLLAECSIRAIAFTEDFLPYIRRIRSARIARFLYGS
jgi:uncharacterized protein